MHRLRRSACGAGSGWTGQSCQAPLQQPGLCCGGEVGELDLAAPDQEVDQIIGDAGERGTAFGQWLSNRLR
jgi:hypothetical protein